jgi:hypothetical protein
LLDIDLYIDIDIKILYNLVSTEKKTGANVNVSCFIASIVIKKSFFKKMAGGWANSPGGWAPPNHALPWIRHYIELNERKKIFFLKTKNKFCVFAYHHF